MQLESTESESTRSVAVNESRFFKKLLVTSFFLMQIKKKKEGKTDLAKFTANSGAKAVDEALNVGWE